MQRESTSSIPRQSPRALLPRAAAAPLLAELERRFTLFHSQYGRGTRVPEELRAAVRDVLSAGVAMSSLRRTCGLSRSQISGWRPSRRRLSVDKPSEPVKVRTFSVVDGEPAAQAVPSSRPELPLELRLGHWLVSVRHDRLVPVGRG